MARSNRPKRAHSRVRITNKEPTSISSFVSIAHILGIFNNSLLSLQFSPNEWWKPSPSGFIGVNCEIKSETCENGLVCLNGGKCAASNNTQVCDCTAAEELFAGEQCEFAATVTCENGGENSTDVSFCSNNGTCIVVDGNHAGCSCPEGFNGEKCQFLVGQSVASSRGARLSQTNSAVALSLSFFLALFALFGTTFRPISDTRLEVRWCVELQ